MALPKETKQLFEKKAHQIRAFFEKAMQNNEKRKLSNRRKNGFKGSPSTRGQKRGLGQRSDNRNVRQQLKLLEKRLHNQNRRGGGARKNRAIGRKRDLSTVSCYRCNGKARFLRTLELLGDFLRSSAAVGYKA